jgi:hypothetical protein
LKNHAERTADVLRKRIAIYVVGGNEMAHEVEKEHAEAKA